MIPMPKLALTRDQVPEMLDQWNRERYLKLDAFHTRVCTPSFADETIKRVLDLKPKVLILYRPNDRIKFLFRLAANNHQFTRLIIKTDDPTD